MTTTPIRFCHKASLLRLEAVESYMDLCGDKDDRCKCALFHYDCKGICYDVRDITGFNVYFKEVSNENR